MHTQSFHLHTFANSDKLLWKMENTQINAVRCSQGSELSLKHLCVCVSLCLRLCRSLHPASHSCPTLGSVLQVQLRAFPANRRSDRNNSQALQGKQWPRHTTWKPLCVLWAAHLSKNAPSVFCQMVQPTHTHAQTCMQKWTRRWFLHMFAGVTFMCTKQTHGSFLSRDFSRRPEYTACIVRKLCGS